MSFLTWRGPFPANPYDSLNPAICRGSIVLAHPGEVDSLVLTTSDGDAYQREETNWLRSDGRSLQGGLRITGSMPTPEQWVGNFAVKLPQLALFRNFLMQQKTSATPITLIDHWVPTLYRTVPVFLSVDDRWKTPIGHGHWYRIQFRAEEIL
jgi:hypothetical protein